MLTQNRVIWVAATCLAAILTFQSQWTPAPSSHDVAPVPLNFEEVRSAMGYPETAYLAGIQGDVVLEIAVDAQGNYLAHTVVESFHPLLRIPCEWMAPKLSFTPAQSQGQAVAGTTQLTFSFVIPE